MSAIQIDHLSFAYDDPHTRVFEDLTLTLDTTWRTALVGRNGKGKTTLLRLLAGQLTPDLGVIHAPSTMTLFSGTLTPTKAPVRAVIRDAIGPFDAWEREMEALLAVADPPSLERYGVLLEAFDAAGGYDLDARIEREAAALGLDAALLARPWSTLSGGEQTRALIIALFLRPASFPLLDEPTNHLDLDGRDQLARYLASQRGFILVSHDRHFLDRCVDHVVSVNRSDVRVNQGTFTSWRDQMDQELAHEARRDAHLRSEIKALERAAVVRRGHSNSKERERIGTHPADRGAIGHKSAKLMKRALAIERRTEQRIEEKRALLQNATKARRLTLAPRDGGPQRCMTAEGITLAVGDRTLFRDLSFSLDRGERVALVGPNGCGKTTLLRALTGEVPVHAGTIRVPGYLAWTWAYQTPRWQHGMLDAHLAGAQLDAQRFRTILASLGVTGDIFTRPLETFSLGERKKVDLCRSFIEPAHVLIWDEPLNDIDVDGRAQLEAVILAHEPTLLFIAHDRHFIDAVATRVVTLGTSPRDG